MSLRTCMSILLLSASALACNEGSFSGGGGKTAAVPPKKEVPEEKTDDAKPKEKVADKTVGPTKTPATSTETTTPGPVTNNPTAVTAGSFTVYAEPPNPGQLQPYDIIIQVKLPANTVNYQLGDITGNLRGTDGYEQGIPNGPSNDGGTPPPAIFNVAGQIATIRVKVPGAFVPKTQDAVTLHSVLLNENQTVTIQFQ